MSIANNNYFLESMSQGKCNVDGEENNNSCLNSQQHNWLQYVHDTTIPDLRENPKDFSVHLEKKEV